jgi:NADH:ubiquinone oxidoreductase subunit K
MFVDETGQIAALLVVLVGMCELGVIVAIVLRSLREDPDARLLDDWSGQSDEQGEP